MFGKGNIMAETTTTGSEAPAMTNIAGGAMLVIILALAAVIWFQQGQLSKAVETLAIVSTKCANK